MPKLTRKSYTVKEKLDLLGALQASGLNRRTFAKSRGLNESTIRTWQAQEEKLRELPKSKIKTVRYMCDNRKGHFEDIDAAVLAWVQERNQKGLRVKDKFIQLHARQVRDEQIALLDDGEPQKELLQQFGASKIWCHRFKKRNNLCSRRHTTTHRLPDGFREAAMEFIADVQGKCREFNIPRGRIVNMDQVSRYYENDKSSTIAAKGTKEILLRKSSTSHKKFTFTPFVTASGKFLIKHALFSKLKKLPTVDKRCKVDVNQTAMWSIPITQKRIDEAVSICRGLFSTRSSVLIILDSYGAHLKFVNENGDGYRARNVHFAIIPPNLTGLLQPLDVGLNRSFQQYFNDRTDEYQGEYLVFIS